MLGKRKRVKYDAQNFKNFEFETETRSSNYIRFQTPLTIKERGQRLELNNNNNNER